MYCIEESACDIVGTLWRPHNGSVPGELCPPHYDHAHRLYR